MYSRTLLLMAALILPGHALASVQTTPPAVASAADQYRNDAAVTSQVKTALLAQKNLDALDINVATRDGVVHLSGFVGSSAQITQAIEVARGVRGVREVRNDLRLKAGQR